MMAMKENIKKRWMCVWKEGNNYIFGEATWNAMCRKPSGFQQRLFYEKNRIQFE